MAAFTLNQYNFNVRYDTETLNSDTGWLAADNTDPGDVDIGTKWRIRFTIDETENKIGTYSAPTLYANYNGGGYSLVTAASSNVRLVGSDQGITDTDPCSTQLLPAGAAEAFGNYGVFSDGTAAIDDILWTTKGDYLEFEFCLEWVTGDVTDGHTCLFQMRSGASVLGGYNNTPTVTVNTDVPVTLSRELSDSLTLTDTLEREVRNVRSLSESLTLTDSLARDVRNLRPLAESLTLTDALLRLVRNDRNLLESLTLSDTLVATVTEYATPSPPTYGIRRRAGRM